MRDAFTKTIDEQADEYVPLSDGSVEEGGDNATGIRLCERFAKR